MLAELSTQQSPDLPIFFEKDVLFIDIQRKLRQTKEQFFIDQLASKYPSETVEDVSSVAHETNRIPDPRILILKDGRILTLFRIPVDHYIEKTSYVGKLEYAAFEKIEEWAKENNQGAEIWFSGKHPGKYPTDKVDIGVIRYTSNEEEKVLLKRAILLDVEPGVLIGLANKFADRIGIPRFISVDEMRARPIFCSEDELDGFLEIISKYTNQVDQILDCSDLEIKIQTYENIGQLENEIIISDHVPHGNVYDYVRRRAEQEMMIGDKSESCPTTKTAFQVFSGTSEGGKYVKNCGQCGVPINAFISAGYRCSNCGGIYKGC